MKMLMVFIADREGDADGVRRILQETVAGAATVVGPDFATLDTAAGEWQPTRPRHRLRNLPWTVASFTLATVLTGAAWTGFTLGVVSGALARQVRTHWNGAPGAEPAEVLKSAVFVVADSHSTEEIAKRLTQFEGKVLRVPLAAVVSSSAAPVQEGDSAVRAAEKSIV